MTVESSLCLLFLQDIYKKNLFTIPSFNNPLKYIPVATLQNNDSSEQLLHCLEPRSLKAFQMHKFVTGYVSSSEVIHKPLEAMFQN